MIDTETSVLLKNNKVDSGKTVWLGLPFREEELGSALRAIGLTEESGEDEYVVADFRSRYSSYFSEGCFHNIFEASDLVEKIESLDRYHGDVFEALIDYGESAETAIEDCMDDDIEFYPDRDLVTLAEEFYDEGILSKELILSHIDWEGVGRELGIDGYTECSTGVLRRW
jgi:hypothetical protein